MQETSGIYKYKRSMLAELVTGLPDVATVYELVRVGREKSDNGAFMGELDHGEFKWRTYDEVV